MNRDRTLLLGSTGQSVRRGTRAERSGPADARPLMLSLLFSLLNNEMRREFCGEILAGGRKPGAGTYLGRVPAAARAQPGSTHWVILFTYFDVQAARTMHLLGQPTSNKYAEKGFKYIFPGIGHYCISPKIGKFRILAYRGLGSSSSTIQESENSKSLMN